MRLKNTSEVNDFLKAVESCTGTVYLTSVYGDKIVLTSPMSKYVAIGALIDGRGEQLELFCENKKDEEKFLKFFYEHEGVL